MVALGGTIKDAPPNVRGFDKSVAIASLAEAQGYYNQGFRFCLRYLSLGARQAHNDLSSLEASWILQAGLALMPVQHVRFSPWDPNGPLGTQTGAHATSNAINVGFPSGVNVWLDLEGIRTGTNTQDVINYCNSCYAQVAAAGYIPGIYVGFNCILDSNQLYSDLKFKHYWRAGGNIPDIATRGYQMIQHIPSDPNDDIDTNITQKDKLGGQVLWLTQQ